MRTFFRVQQNDSNMAVVERNNFKSDKYIPATVDVSIYNKTEVKYLNAFPSSPAIDIT